MMTSSQSSCERLLRGWNSISSLRFWAKQAPVQLRHPSQPWQPGRLAPAMLLAIKVVMNVVIEAQKAQARPGQPSSMNDATRQTHHDLSESTCSEDLVHVVGFLLVEAGRLG